MDIINADSRETCGRIDNGSVVLLDVTHQDTETGAKYIVDKVANLRISEGEAGKLDLSLKDTGGTVLLVSQFTFYVDARNGCRPSCSDAAPTIQADEPYRLAVDLLCAHGLYVETRRFQTHMQINLCNNGPVMLLSDSQKLF